LSFNIDDRTDDRTDDTEDSEDKIDIHNFSIRQHGGYIALGLIFTCITLPIFIATLTKIDYHDIRTVLAILFGVLPLVLFGPFIIIIRVRWEIEIKDNQITYTPYIGKTETFTLDYITRVKHGTRPLRYERVMHYFKAYHHGIKIFTVTGISPEIIILLALLKNNGVEIEE
jgi:hypothetical protein